MKKEKIALIDGDVIVYWAANWAQTNYFDIMNLGGPLPLPLQTYNQPKINTTPLSKSISEANTNGLFYIRL